MSNFLSFRSCKIRLLYIVHHNIPKIDDMLATVSFGKFQNSGEFGTNLCPRYEKSVRGFVIVPLSSVPSSSFTRSRFADGGVCFIIHCSFQPRKVYWCLSESFSYKFRTTMRLILFIANQQEHHAVGQNQIIN